MGTRLRTELSKSNRYYISKERRLELEHFCRQYKEWKKELGDIGINGYCIRERVQGGKVRGSQVEDMAIKRNSLESKIKMVEDCAEAADTILAPYILKSVTENRSYTNMLQVYNIPAGKDMFYDRLHKFYWLLDRVRD